MKRIRERMIEWELSPKTILGIAGLVVLVALYLALPYLDRGGPAIEIKGTVIAPFALTDTDRDAYYMRVNLESGQEVRVPIPRTVPVRPGKAVVLIERRGSLSGFPRYRFARYAEGGA